MTKRTIIENNQFILSRPRISRLLKRNLNSSLVALVAGPGFGKTTAVASFAEEVKGPVAWVTLTSFDNDINNFWQTIIRATKKELPQLSELLEGFTFPETASKRTKFFLTAANLLAELKERPVFIVDNANFINNKELKTFFIELTKVNAQHNLTCNIIISNEKLFSRNERMGIVDNSVHPDYIEAKELAFTPKEMQGIFNLYGSSITEEEAQALFDQTGGWVLLIKHICEKRSMTSALPTSDLKYASELFENQYYAKYEGSVQVLLAVLSVLPFFNADLARDIAGNNFDKLLDVLEGNLFVEYDFVNSKYTFQTLYQQFLHNKAKQLPKEYLNNVFDLSAEYYLKNERYELACKMYFNSGNYSKLIHTVMGKIPYTAAEIHDVLEIFAKLPPGYINKEPYAALCTAQLYYNDLQINRAKKIAEDLLAQYENGTEKEKHTKLLGETYILLANISLIENNFNGLSYMKKAAQYLPNGTSYEKNYYMSFAQNDMFFLVNNEAGSVKEAVAFIHEYAKYQEQVTPNDGDGCELLFEAEAAYYEGNLLQLQSKGFQAMYKAKKAKQYGVVVSAHYLLTKAALFMGDYEKFAAHLNEIIAYLETENQAELLELFKMVQNYLDKKVGVSTDKTDSREYVVNIYEDIPIWQGRNLLVNVTYLLLNKKYFEAMAVLAELDYILTKRALWTVRLETAITKAIALFHLGETKKAEDEFTKAYDMTFNNNLYVPFAQFGTMITALLHHMISLKAEHLDADWLNLLLEKALGFNQNIQKIVKAYKIDNGKALVGNTRLSPREQTVLYYLVQGLTREQISHEMKISVNGVKKHLSNIYVKLGAKNRAEAIHIATLNQLTPDS